MTVPTSYDTLKTAIAERRGRVGDAEFEAYAPTLVFLAEASLNRMVPVRLAEADAALTGTVGSRLIALPADFLEPVALFLVTFGRREKLFPMVAGAHELGTTNGRPARWQINGASLELDVPCAEAYGFSFRYRKKFFDLAAASPNWLLTNHPDLYLAACLMEAADYEMDDAALADYRARYEELKREVRWLEARGKARAPLTVDPALLAAPGFDIVAG